MVVRGNDHGCTSMVTPQQITNQCTGDALRRNSQELQVFIVTSDCIGCVDPCPLHVVLLHGLEGLVLLNLLALLRLLCIPIQLLRLKLEVKYYVKHLIAHLDNLLHCCV